MKANMDSRTVVSCFGHCVDGVDTTDLTAIEKNCIRECYFKKLNARDDYTFYQLQAKFMNDQTQYKFQNT